MSAFSVKFGKAGLRDKLWLLFNREGFAMTMTALFLIAFGMLYYAIGVVGLASVELVFFQHGYQIYSLFNMGWILAFAILGYYPLRVMATLTMVWRYQKLSKTGATVGVPVDTTGGDGGMDITVDELRSILKLAEDNKTDRVRLFLGPTGAHASP
jgi:hypothetical protein